MQQREGLIAGLALAACAQAPAPAPEALPAPAPETVVWRLTGRVELPVRASGPPPFVGARDQLDRCGEERPCAAELWRDDSGGELRLLRLGDRIEGDIASPSLPASPWLGAWQSIEGTLGACLGDPLTDRLGGDTAGRRELQLRAGAARWVIHLSGDNRCRLRGELGLELTRDRADTRALVALDAADTPHPWSDAGRRVARVRLVAFVRDHAAELYTQAEAEERALLLRHLLADPELAPLAAALERPTAR